MTYKLIWIRVGAKREGIDSVSDFSWQPLEQIGIALIFGRKLERAHNVHFDLRLDANGARKMRSKTTSFVSLIRRRRNEKDQPVLHRS